MAVGGPTIWPTALFICVHCEWVGLRSRPSHCGRILRAILW